MNTLQLLETLNENGKTHKHFKGVFPSDCLPKEKLKKPAFVLANTQDHLSPGEHWVGFYFPKGDGKGEYFDSFGMKPLNAEFVSFLQRNCTSFTYNKKQLQGNFSTTCGQWCCTYMYYKCMGKTLKDFLRQFSDTNFEFNDHKMIHLYQKYFFKALKRKCKNQRGGKRPHTLPYIQCCVARNTK